jgi:hypothetical protein
MIATAMMVAIAVRNIANNQVLILVQFKDVRDELEPKINQLTFDAQKIGKFLYFTSEKKIIITLTLSDRG